MMRCPLFVVCVMLKLNYPEKRMSFHGELCYIVYKFKAEMVGGEFYGSAEQNR